MAAEYNATVIDRVEIAPGLLSLRVAPDKLPFDFQPGQYVVLGLKASEPRIDDLGAERQPDGEAGTSFGAGMETDRMIRRAYCIASESRADKYLDFLLTLILSGELTPRLFSLEPGARLHVGAKAVGVFTLARATNKHIAMVATGTGVAPYMSMIRSELAVRVNSRIGARALTQCNGSRHFVLLQGARHSWDLGYRTEFTGLARRCANFHYLPAITRPKEDETWSGRTGYLQDIVASDAVQRETGLALTPDNFHLFLCGNPAMIETVKDWAQGRGFVRDKGRVVGTLHVEEYW
jgi:ferredoxin--NADP+ reductase